MATSGLRARRGRGRRARRSTPSRVSACGTRGRAQPKITARLASEATTGTAKASATPMRRAHAQGLGGEAADADRDDRDDGRGDRGATALPRRARLPERGERHEHEGDGIERGDHALDELRPEPPGRRLVDGILRGRD